MRAEPSARKRPAGAQAVPASTAALVSWLIVLGCGSHAALQLFPQSADGSAYDDRADSDGVTDVAPPPVDRAAPAAADDAAGAGRTDGGDRMPFDAASASDGAPDGVVCLPGDHCDTCTSDMECNIVPIAPRRCDPTAHRCVECLSNSDCIGMQCDQTTQMCL